MEKKLRVAILGATGMVGQRFITLLENHPWFEVAAVAASPRSSGIRYLDAVSERWKMAVPVPEKVRDMMVLDIYDIEQIKSEVDFVFCALNMSKDKIVELEEMYAKAEIPVVSNNSANRATPDVPMVVPEINPEHIEIIERQKKRLGTKHGFIAVKPNCSIQSYTPALFAWKDFEPKEVMVSTYQAISGSGRTFREWPEMEENLIPFINGEEEKSEKEPLRILGEYQNGEIVPKTEMKISAQCLRVSVLNGHTATCAVRFGKKPTKEELIKALEEFESEPVKLGLPSAPNPFMRYMEDETDLNVKKDVNFQHGMGVSFARLREDSIFDFKFVGLSHNTIRGAAGGAILLAELLYKKGYINSF